MHTSIHITQFRIPDYWLVNSSVDIGASAKLELVDKFCYLGDMLSVDGDADAAVEARIRIGWNKFRQLVPHTHTHPFNGPFPGLPR